MLARHAESLFWTGRYVERAEDTARLLDVTYHALLGVAAVEARRTWRDLLAVLSPATTAFAEPGEDLVGRRRSREFLVLDDDNPGSIVASVDRARENIR